MQVTQEDAHDTDEHIALRVQQGDKEAFGTLVDRYEPKISRYGMKFLSRNEDIQDIVQDIFLSAYQNIQGFNTAQRFSPWIYRIAHNTFINALKKHSHRPLTLIDFDALVSHIVYEDPAESERTQKEMRAMIDKGLEQVAPKYKEVLILYYLEDMSYKEIAQVLHIPTSTVGIRLKRAKEALKSVYTQTNTLYAI